MKALLTTEPVVFTEELTLAQLLEKIEEDPAKVYVYFPISEWEKSPEQRDPRRCLVIIGVEELDRLLRNAQRQTAGDVANAMNLGAAIA